MIASGLPRIVCGDCLICESAIQLRMISAMAGSGPIQPSARPRMTVIMDASAKPWLCCLRGCSGGGGGCHTGVIGGRSSGATQPTGSGATRGSHCVSCSERVSTFGSRIIGFQLGSTGGASSSISIVPSSEQNVIQASVYWRLHCGQYFICEELQTHQTSSRRLKK